MKNKKYKTGLVLGCLLGLNACASLNNDSTNLNISGSQDYNPALIGGYTKSVTFQLPDDAYILPTDPRIITLQKNLIQNNSGILYLRYNSLLSKVLATRVSRNFDSNRVVLLEDKTNVLLNNKTVTSFIKFQPLEKTLLLNNEENPDFIVLAKKLKVTNIMMGKTYNDTYVVTFINTKPLRMKELNSHLENNVTLIPQGSSIFGLFTDKNLNEPLSPVELNVNLEKVSFYKYTSSEDGKDRVIPLVDNI